MHERDAIVYRVTFQGDALPKELVATDARQAIGASTATPSTW